MNSQYEPLDLVMLVDDDDTTNFVNKRLLLKLGVAKEILVKKHGVEALDYLREAEESNSGKPYPNMIFLDLKMPVMDGFKFLDEYHKQEHPKGMIILMLTSSASFYDLERLKGYEHVKKHFSKALTEADIKEIMSQYHSR